MPDHDLVALWEAHCRYEFETGDVDASKIVECCIWQRDNTNRFGHQWQTGSGPDLLVLLERFFSS
jgi:hypothetical protein